MPVGSDSDLAPSVAGFNSCNRAFKLPWLTLALVYCESYSSTLCPHPLASINFTLAISSSLVILLTCFFSFSVSKHQESLTTFIQHHCCIKILLSRLLARNAPCHDQYEPQTRHLVPSPPNTFLFLFFALSRGVYERPEVEKTRRRTSTTTLNYTNLFYLLPFPSRCISPPPPRRGLVSFPCTVITVVAAAAGTPAVIVVAVVSWEHPVHEMSLFLPLVTTRLFT